MNHKNIYDHLADIYLDTDSNKNNSNRTKKNFEIEHEKEIEASEQTPGINIYKILFFVISVAVFCGVFLLLTANRKQLITLESSLVLMPEAAKIDFVFEPAQKSIYSIGLDKLDLRNYKSLKFLAKTGNPKDEISLRVELNNSLNEKSEVYLSALSGKWKEYTLDLASFKKITNWSTINTVSFILEEWNSVQNKGTIYFDNVRLTN